MRGASPVHSCVKPLNPNPKARSLTFTSGDAASVDSQYRLEPLLFTAVPDPAERMPRSFAYFRYIGSGIWCSLPHPHPQEGGCAALALIAPSPATRPTVEGTIKPAIECLTACDRPVCLGILVLQGYLHGVPTSSASKTRLKRMEEISHHVGCLEYCKICSSKKALWVSWCEISCIHPNRVVLRYCRCACLASAMGSGLAAAHVLKNGQACTYTLASHWISVFRRLMIHGSSSCNTQKSGSRLRRSKSEQCEREHTC